MGKTITGDVTKTVTLGVDGYTSPLTIASNAQISPTAPIAYGLYAAPGVFGTVVNNGGILGASTAGYYGGRGVVLLGAVTLTNNSYVIGGYGGAGGGGKGYGLHGGGGLFAEGADKINNIGAIDGGGGGPGYYAGGLGGLGVYLGNSDGTTLTNAPNAIGGGIFGGAGGAGYYDGGDGGFGLYMLGAATNESVILGGAGGGDQKGNVAGNGGIGVELYHALTLTNTAQGVVTGGAGGNAERFGVLGGDGGDGVYIKISGHVSNFGHITGGAGGSITQTKTTGAGGAGGIGLVASGAELSFSNAGTITGGAGGDGNGGSGAGGFGVAIYGASGSSSGLIIGGPALYNAVATSAGHGGDGAYVNHGTLNNTGTIYGGYGEMYGGAGVKGAQAALILNTGTITGGVVAEGSNAGEFGHMGGTGVSLASGATLINTGSITGGAGGFGQFSGGAGGTGVVVDGGLISDAGTISGGAGGPAFEGDAGAAGYALSFTGAGTLAVLSGAVFDGTVAADAAVTDVLELAGESTRALTGIGTQFTGFENITFAVGAVWTIAGDEAGLAAGQHIGGFAAGDAIVLDGFTNTVAPGFSDGVLALENSNISAALAVTFATALTGDLLVTDGGGNTTLSLAADSSSVTLAAGVNEIVLSGGTATEMTVDAGAVLTVAGGGKLTGASVKGMVKVLSSGTAFDLSLAKGAALTVSGGTINGSVIAFGADASLNSGIATNTTLAGGVVDLTDGAKLSGKIEFKDTGGVLDLQQSQLPTVVISGFAAGDEIILGAAAASGTVKVTAAGKVTISAGGKSYKLDIAGAEKGSTDYVFANHALTEKPAKMAFARPVASVAPAPAALPELVAAGGYQAITAPAPSPTSASTSAYSGFAFEPFHVPNGGIQTVVTLQS